MNVIKDWRVDVHKYLLLQSIFFQFNTQRIWFQFFVPKQPRLALTTSTELIYNHLCWLEMFSSGTAGHEMSQLEYEYSLPHFKAASNWFWPLGAAPTLKSADRHTDLLSDHVIKCLLHPQLCSWQPDESTFNINSAFSSGAFSSNTSDEINMKTYSSAMGCMYEWMNEWMKRTKVVGGKMFNIQRKKPPLQLREQIWLQLASRDLAGALNFSLAQKPVWTKCIFKDKIDDCMFMTVPAYQTKQRSALTGRLALI